MSISRAKDSLKNRLRRIGVTRTLWIVFFGAVFVVGNLKDSPLYRRYFSYTKIVFQTLGFEQRWGMYGYDYTTIQYTRYVYNYQGGMSKIIYPRYWRQQQFNPFQYVKTEDFQWLYRGDVDSQDLVTRLIKYMCRHPDSDLPPPQSITFQVASAQFPNLEDQRSWYDEKRFSPLFQSVITVHCEL